MLCLCAITDNDVYVLLDRMVGWGVKGRGDYTDTDTLLLLFAWFSRCSDRKCNLNFSLSLIQII